jgi:redox-sensing transcriptional repressor
MSSAMMSELPRATVERLPQYLRLLDDIGEARVTISSEQLAEASGANAANVRRDLLYLDFHGMRGVGYSIEELRARIRDELGISHRRNVAIVGAGNLGRALANYGGLTRRGFDVAAIYDRDPEKVGTAIGNLTIQPIEDLANDLVGGLFDMAILAVPGNSAQQVADILAKWGIASILNFAPVRVEVPDSVYVRQVDLSMELQVLSYYGDRPRG